MTKRETTPCHWCGEPTAMLNTRECDSCWELSTRIARADRSLVLRMLGPDDARLEAKADRALPKFRASAAREYSTREEVRRHYRDGFSDGWNTRAEYDRLQRSKK